jgi:hypothetical protein
LLIEQAHKLIEIVNEILQLASLLNERNNSVTQLRMVELASDFKKNVMNQHQIMKVKGWKLRE